MKGFRSRVSSAMRKDNSTNGTSSSSKTTPSRSASGDASPLSSRFGSGRSNGTESPKPRRTVSRSSTGSTSSLSAKAAPKTEQSKEKDPFADNAPAVVQEPSSMSDPDQQARAPEAPAPAPPEASTAAPEPPTQVEPEAPTPPPMSPPQPRPIAMVWDVQPLAINTDDVPRRGEPKPKASDESFVKLPEEDGVEMHDLQMPDPLTVASANPFLDQPESPPTLAIPVPTKPGNGKSVSFLQTVQEISPVSDFTSSQMPSPAVDVPPSSIGASPNATWNWTEHILPDTSYYYTLPMHLSPTRSPVVTDMDLRAPHTLRLVEAYLRTITPLGPSVDPNTPPPPMPEPATPSEAGKTTWQQVLGVTPSMPSPLTPNRGGLVEVYLRNVASRASSKGVGQDEFVPLTMYVRHGARSVSAQLSEDGPRSLSDAERLDQETQYWRFMETHPAHVALPDSATEEAFEALTWSYTDRVLQSYTAARVGSPFSERECHELLELLRGLNGAPKFRQATHTRIVSKIHLRMAQWRQQFVSLGDSGGYPPRKSNASFSQMSVMDSPGTRAAVPFKGTFLRFFFGVLCLGIPYLFYSASNKRHELVDDEDNGSGNGWNWRNATALVTTAAVCLVGAVMLSVSVTFLALPGLERLARILAMVSVICSLGSLAASFLVMPRRPGSAVTFTRARALPAVLLAYAVASFVGATIAYAADSAVQQSQRDMTWWIVVGVWAVLATVLAVAAWTLRTPSSSRGAYRALPS
ncbi:hypothetical protein EXIGLDRAFT_384497 [Exidia glandulosa HHB12029]|uniref:Uncharacterized protein n=1 Tax=Exidia glandulosa HHB12029 TaxID=1314781 RepID=A0A165BXQ2_EXIGL|nr:hypothetical protein EXIGLDRAFT_384497 [Exidia glandulosa HHB12029]